MRRLVPVIVALIALSPVACGESDGGGDAEDAPAAPERAEKPAERKPPACKKAGQAQASSIRDSLTRRRGAVRRLNVVKLSDPPEAPLAGYRSGVYAVAGEFTGPGIDRTVGIWAASPSMVKTGGGRIIRADSVTRELSELGAAPERGSPAAKYAAEVAVSEEGEHARKCAEGASGLSGSTTSRPRQGASPRPRLPRPLIPSPRK